MSPVRTIARRVRGRNARPVPNTRHLQAPRESNGLERMTQERFSEEPLAKEVGSKPASPAAIEVSAMVISAEMGRGAAAAASSAPTTAAIGKFEPFRIRFAGVSTAADGTPLRSRSSRIVGHHDDRAFRAECAHGRLLADYAA